ncbi:hypothetical protein EDD18DRAFT_1159861 [Armillaria luteobubalina]|uniref:Arf-GAP domain-containing protein n=1 Tax=Armillaria luteobubalina TaxID=153913 RepID=A0AA39Q7V7_9AGAR|nr:hypothetical protein EDD18DRAFT_1159861 [Armillaria luteobubalina]
MSRQDKATTERFTKTLRELVKKPENKLCADCKRNDPRWASWNIGVFLCIRCSGIHRGMGTHISRVKSVDLDVWTPEQMESIQKWGNHRANLYWEAHLKPGHIPPDHKMESFIRSKYESRRWAMEGPPPQDPLVLENGSSAVPPPQQQQPATPTFQTARASPSRVPVTNRQPQPHHLLSAGYASQQKTTPAPVAAAPAPPPPQPQPKPSDDLFSLDFHSPVSSSPPPQQDAQQKKDVKQDILSLFSSAPSATPATASPWSQPQPQQPQQQQQTTSMMGAGGAGMWGVSSGWNAAAPPPAQPNLWGAPAPQQPQPSLFASSAAIWGSPAPSNGTSQASNDLLGSFASSGTTTTTTTTAQKKDDVFGDIWGDFK